MKLTVVIVSYNVKYYVEQCLCSVKRAMRSIDGNIYVIDNHSKDGTIDYLRSRHKDVTFINSNHNMGFARANNIVIKQTDGDYVLLLNPDTIVGEDVLRQCVAFMDAHPRAGGLGVCMHNESGKRAMESRRGLPTPMTAFYKMCGLGALYPRSRRFGKYYMSYLPWDKPVQIEVVSGAFFMIRREAIGKAGLLDEDFFMYGEDIDMSYRLLKAGYDNWFIPADIIHYKGESTQKTSFRYVHVFYQAMLIFLRKHYSTLSLWIAIPVKAAIYAKATAALFRMTAERIHKSLGFTRRLRTTHTQYLFIGKADAMDVCRRIARDNALDARFIVGDSRSLPAGHRDAGVSLNPNGATFVVYDNEAYSFADIIAAFAAAPAANVLMGTFNRSNNTVVTAHDVFM